MRRIHPKPRFYALMIGVVAILVAVSCITVENRLRSGEALLKERQDYRDGLVAEIGDMDEQIEFAQTDAYVERIARDELGLLMPGEVRYVSN